MNIRHLLLSAFCLAVLPTMASVVDLGNTPWRFTKAVRPESNLALGLDALCNGRRVTELNDSKLQTGRGIHGRGDGMAGRKRIRPHGP